MRLLGDDVLGRSNCQMNREWTLTGSNGYSKELGFKPFDLLMEKEARQDVYDGRILATDPLNLHPLLRLHWMQPCTSVPSGRWFSV